MTLCVIPARGGSKAIEHKNIVPVAGKPLIVWSIQQALAARLVSRVWVATDCERIAEIAENAGAFIHWRSPETATDSAATEAVITEWLLSLAEADRDPLAVLLQATSPVRQAGDIDGAIELLVESGADSVFAARVVQGYTWSMYRQCVHPLYTQRLPRQQQTSQMLEENGSLYVFRTEPYLKHNNRLFGRMAAYLMHPLDSYQIDEPQDLELFEQLIPLRMAGAICQ
jgi:N-acylneuraminate cytidylyltransferase